MQAHLVLKAAELVGGPAKLEALALMIRQAFFLRGEDIADLELLVSMTAGLDIDAQRFRAALRNGAAMAALSQDLRNASASGVRGSPTWVLNEGRQVLYGNVGYRILNANIEELMANPKDETSWC
jgi:predicted DsbA family dithiol-disulfide isomerase